MRYSLLGTVFILSLIATSVVAQTTQGGPCGTSYGYTNGNRVVTSPFGARDIGPGSQGATSTFHRGVDIRVNQGQPATANSYMGGTVVQVGQMSGYGNVVIIEHANGFRTMYAHSTMPTVTVGQVVKAGDVVADYSGACSGNCTGPHIHFETQVLVDGKWMKVDPAIAESLAQSGICPGSDLFNNAAVQQTTTKHGVDADKLAGGSGGAAIGVNVCTEQQPPQTPPPSGGGG